MYVSSIDSSSTLLVCSHQKGSIDSYRENVPHSRTNNIVVIHPIKT